MAVVIGLWTCEDKTNQYDLFCCADRAIRHRACALRDTAQALLKAELDPEFERVCQEITQSRKRRGMLNTLETLSFIGRGVLLQLVFDDGLKQKVD